MKNKKNLQSILLVNTGTPSEPEPKAIRSYLKEFLSDKRVIKIPRIIWLPILYLFILTIRPYRKINDYKKIWTKKGSPLLVIFKSLLKKLKDNSKGTNNYYRIAMRYGKPAIKDQLIFFKEKKISKLIILPLFPQFSYSTTASVIDKVKVSLKEIKWNPQLKIIKEYYKEKLFIDSISKSIVNEWKKNGEKNFLIFSYHGLPKKYVQQGDTYYKACCNTSELIANKLNINSDEYITSFHSKFGFGEWTKPYTEDLLNELPKKGMKSIDILSPAFSIDCLETLEEIAIQFKNDFIKAGGRNFNYIPCLNDSDEHTILIQKLVS